LRSTLAPWPSRDHRIDLKEAAVNTITVEGRVTDEPDLGYGLENGTPACVVRLRIDRVSRPGGRPDPFTVLVVGYGPVGHELANQLHAGCLVLVSGSLDCFELPTDDGSHFCQHVVVAKTFGIVSDEPF
jgi:single-stranded DNA-binding protein